MLYPTYKSNDLVLGSHMYTHYIKSPKDLKDFIGITIGHLSN